MSARSKARKRALDICFEADSKSLPVAMVLNDHIRRRTDAGDGELNAYTSEIVNALTAHSSEIDAVITANSRDWGLDRMPSVDRAILRIGTAELLYCPATPHAVVISQAVELAQDLSTDGSGAFVHGVLAAISRESASAAVAEATRSD